MADRVARAPCTSVSGVTPASHATSFICMYVPLFECVYLCRYVYSAPVCPYTRV